MVASVLGEDKTLPLGVELRSLEGKTLACDCPLDCACEGDILAGLVFDAGRPRPEAHPSASERPRVEDLVNAPPFSDFLQCSEPRAQLLPLREAEPLCTGNLSQHQGPHFLGNSQQGNALSRKALAFN